MKKDSGITITDQFCGAGGSSKGASMVPGVKIRLALNHWDLAIKTHNTNFPNTDHDCTDVSAVDPLRYYPTNILITSPECTWHSLAKGSRKKSHQTGFWEKPDPAGQRSRATMWDVPRFAEAHDYECIIVENVVDARRWPPFMAWISAMKSFNYKCQIIYFNSMFAHPTPQSRDRMYVIFWKKGNHAPNCDITPKAWCVRCEKNVKSVQAFKPGKYFGKYGNRNQYVYCCPICAEEVQPYYYAAANIIDWNKPAPRIGDRKRPLSQATMSRIQAGLDKFQKQGWFLVRMKEPTPSSAVGAPGIVDVAHSHAQPSGKVRPASNPGPTQTARQTQALFVAPYIIEMRQNAGDRSEVHEPISTLVAGAKHHNIVVPPAFLSSYYSKANSPKSPMDPLDTVSTVKKHGLTIPPFIVSNYSRDSATKGISKPLPTQPTWAVHYLAQPHSVKIEDCGYRILNSDEVGRGMAFPDDYVVLGTERQRVKQYGNAVTPPVMKILVERCVASLEK